MMLEKRVRMLMAFGANSNHFPFWRTMRALVWHDARSKTNVLPLTDWEHPAPGVVVAT